MNLRDVAYNVVHDYPGGAASLAPRLGKASSQLNHELAGNGAAKLGLMDAEKICHLAGDIRILQAFATNMGQMCVPLPHSYLEQGNTLVMEKLGIAAQQFGELCAEVALDLADNKISDNELARIDREAGELIAAVHVLREELAAMNAKLKADRA